MYFIGADLGTSALKLLLIDEKRRILCSMTETYPVSYPHPGWSEQNPADWWNAFCVGVKKLLAEFPAAEVAGIGVAGQMHGLVALDGEGKVIRPAILWNDGRTSRETAWLNTAVGKQKLSDLTANVAFAGFTAPKLLWMRGNEPENFARIAKILLPKDYLNYRLTGRFATDVSDASGTLYFDVKRRAWSREMLDVLGVKPSQLPEIFESFAPIGTLLPDVARELGLPASVTVAAGAGDNAAAAIGTGTVGAGRCNISLGTSGTVFISSDRFSVDPFNALHSFCHADGGYHLMGCILSAASCNQWFCGKVLETTDYEGEQAKIARENLGRNRAFFLPYLMGERSPINDTDATGLFIGLRPDTTRADLLQAVMEGVCFAIRDNLEVAVKQGISPTESSVCGGGAKSHLWLEILASVLNIDLLVPTSEEGPGMGGALLAMSACGLDGGAVPQIKERIRPDPALVRRYEERYRKYREIYPAIKNLYQTLSEDDK